MKGFAFLLSLSINSNCNKFRCGFFNKKEQKITFFTFFNIYLAVPVEEELAGVLGVLWLLWLVSGAVFLGQVAGEPANGQPGKLARTCDFPHAKKPKIMRGLRISLPHVI